jgi:hypothetical protein
MHGNYENAYKILVERPEKRGHSKDLGIDKRIILKCILQKQGGRMWTELIWFRMQTSGGIL